MDDDEGIKNYFAAFHLHDTFPAAVVVDDFGDFFEERCFVSNFIFSSITPEFISVFTIFPIH